MAGSGSLGRANSCERNVVGAVRVARGIHDPLSDVGRVPLDIRCPEWHQRAGNGRRMQRNVGSGFGLGVRGAVL